MRNCVGGFFLNVAGRPEILVLIVVAVRERLVSGSPIGSCASLACLVAEGCGGRRDVTRRDGANPKSETNSNLSAGSLFTVCEDL